MSHSVVVGPSQLGGDLLHYLGREGRGGVRGGEGREREGEGAVEGDTAKQSCK